MENTLKWKRGDPIGYIRREIPRFEVPAYKGERYEAIVPDTLDIQERAALAVHGLTAPTDPDADYEIYWLVWFGTNPPIMRHDWSDAVQTKFMEALPLMRIASGSDLNNHVDQRWMEVALHTLGPDGLSYVPAVGRPWARLGDTWGSTDADNFALTFACGRLMSAMTVYYLRGRAPVWKEAIERMVAGLTELAIDKGSYAYFPRGAFSPDVPRVRDAEMPTEIRASLVGWVIQGLAQYYRAAGYEPARALATKLTRYLREQGNFYDAQGRFLPNGPQFPGAHFHHHTLPLLGMLEHALATGDRELMEFVRQGYQYGKANGEPLVGYFPENIGRPDLQTSESCEVADMIALGLKLTEAGVGDYWDDVDRWVRNQFAENQLLRGDWIYRFSGRIDPSHVYALPRTSVDETYQTADRVPERNVGAFAGWPWPNDFYAEFYTGYGSGLGIMHCCTGNGARALYYIWENILSYADGTLRVNLLLNRASPWADVDSYIPYEGRVEVKIKQSCRLAVRIPEWATPTDTTCHVNGAARPLEWDRRYAKIGAVQTGDLVALTFPIAERTVKVAIEKRSYTLVLKGNDVVLIEPPGKNCPLYQRAHYRENQARWRKATRFVSEEVLYW